MVAFNVSGKYAVVTGITLEYVKLVLAKGCSVVAGDLALRHEAEEVVKAYPHPSTELRKASFVFQKTDVTSVKELDALWDTVTSTFPQVDLVIPGAGVYEPESSSFWFPPGAEGSPSTDAIESNMSATFGINLSHPIRLSPLALAYWTSHKIQGTILFLGSIAGYTATAGTPYYYFSKHGLHGFVCNLGFLRGRLGIWVARVAPGATRTPLWDSPHCKDKLTQKDPQLKSEYVAQVMLEVTEDEKYGDDNIIEVVDLGTAEEPKPSVREVPTHLIYPVASGVGVPTLILEEEEELWKRPEAEGCKA